MRDLYEVLREKEEAIQRVAREIRILRMAVSLLSDGADDASLLPPAPTEQEMEMLVAGQLSPPVQTNPPIRESRPPIGGARPPVPNHPDGWTQPVEDLRGTMRKISDRLRRLATPLLNASRFAS